MTSVHRPKPLNSSPFRRSSRRGRKIGRMVAPRSILIPFAVVSVGTLLAGCGGSSSKSPTKAPSQSSPPPTTAAAPPPAASTQGSASGPLTAEAQSAAAGDIPDNQVFLTFRDSAAGFSMQYPEGWAQRGSGSDVAFQDKSNVVHVVVSSGQPLGLAGVRGDLARLKTATPSFRAQAPSVVTISSKPAVKVVYTTESKPSPVTGKRVTLVVDRYYLAHGDKRAVVDLGAPRGVDNVDAYRLIIQSFRWK